MCWLQRATFLSPHPSIARQQPPAGDLAVPAFVEPREILSGAP
jgi:hypothetical protein